MKDALSTAKCKPTLAEFLGIACPGAEMLRGIAGEDRKPLQILRWIGEVERFRVNRSNARCSKGAPVAKHWFRTLGMDPLDALAVKDLLAELGADFRPTQWVKMVVDHAISVDAPAPGDLPLRADVTHKRRVKSFFEAPAASFVKAHNTRISDLPSNRGAMVAELLAIRDRIWSG